MKLNRWFTAAISWIPLLSAAAFAADGFQPNEWYRCNNFIEWHHNTVLKEKFAAVKSEMPRIYERGARSVFFYCPFNGNPDAWAGCDPIDLWETYPESGSLQDFRDMAKAAHDLGIAVGMYHTPLYLDWSAPFYRHAAAHPESRQHHCFSWQGSDPVQVWGYPALDYASAEARAELKANIQFWIRNGVTFLQYDAPHTALNGTSARLKEVMSDSTKANGNLMLRAEGTLNEGKNVAAALAAGFTHVCLADDSEQPSIVSGIMSGSASVDDFEAVLVGVRDYAAVRNGGAVQFVDYRRDQGADALACEAAALAGSGVMVDYFYEDPLSRMGWAYWPADARQKFARVANAINSHPAQQPGGGRTRLATRAGARGYAVKRTSVDGRQAALNIYNFDGRPQTVQVDLSGSGITTRQTPVDMMTGGTAAEIDSNIYTVALPGYGFLLLSVKCEAPATAAPTS